jgi:hypothetical protein
MVNLLPLLLLAGFGIAAPSVQSQHTDVPSEPRNVSFCELAKDPDAHNHELVRLTAFVTHGFEDFILTDANCPANSNHFSVWVTYGGKSQSNTIYCCPGEGANQTRSEPLTVEGIQIPLLSDGTFRGFADLLNKEADTTVRVTLAGRFFSGEKETVNGSNYWRGFGHMGCCSLFVIQRVEAFEPHVRGDLDYTSEAGWYEKGGCDHGGLRWLRHVSISSPDETVQQAIEEQKTAESGVRPWAFDDPQRVASESLKPLYQNQVLVLRNVKRTAGRQVFLWKKKNKSVIVVVTRPYWLSFYAKSESVAWVSTTIKEGDCN